MLIKNTKIVFRHVEKKWQTEWARLSVNKINVFEVKKPFYNLMMFPYPSAEGLHVGNMYAFTGSDIYGRFKRMEGHHVFEPIGLDGFGIHSENYCFKIGRHPMDHARITEKKFYAQLRKIGAMFDWSRTVETYKPNYYRYTQWLFIELFKHGLAYRANAEVNWCNACKTVLADEQVIDGECERCGNIVFKKSLTQWFFRITAYAEKLYNNIETLQWSEKVKIAQKNWIGKKQGIEIIYDIVDSKNNRIDCISCFTTRPETNFGATFVVISPTHKFINKMKRVINKKDIDRIMKCVKNLIKNSSKNNKINFQKEKRKTGVFTGLYAVNNLTKRKMPLYVSDYVLANVGTEAVVGVPGHDRRDFEFAQLFNLPVIRVVTDGRNTGSIETIDDVYEGEGVLMNSDFLNGLDTNNSKNIIIDYLVSKSWGKRVTMYHLRDWLISRQRYWGPPIPMIYCEYCAQEGKNYFTLKDTKNNRILFFDAKNLSEGMLGWYPVREEELPVKLPYIKDFQPNDEGVPPLKRHEEFYKTICPVCKRDAVRETEVSDTFLDSSWYFLRYPSVGPEVADGVAFDPDITKRWLPVHMYTGGAEHSVLHLMYSRFITMALHDMGYIDFEEPFTNFYAHGLVIKDGAKMSKSKGNVINPDEYINLYGSDALRLYLMFMGPFSEGGDFRDSAMEGMSRWVGRVWTIIHKTLEHGKLNSHSDISKSLHKLIKKVGDDTERRRYNTAIAAMMEFTNLVEDRDYQISKEDAKLFLKVLAPFAPHITEELYQRLEGRETITDKSQSIHSQPWPTYREDLVIDNLIQIVIQVNGKVRDAIEVSREDADNKDKLVSMAQERKKIRQYVSLSPTKKIVFVPGRLINFVV